MNRSPPRLQLLQGGYDCAPVPVKTSHDERVRALSWAMQQLNPRTDEDARALRRIFMELHTISWEHESRTA